LSSFDATLLNCPAVLDDEQTVAGLLQAGAPQAYELRVIAYDEDLVHHPLHSP
jgi:hypothetical protein